MDKDIEVLWVGRPSGLLQRLLSLVHLNCTKYIITKDDIIVCKFFKKTIYKLYLLKNLKFTSTKYQNSIGVGTLSFINSDDKVIELVNVKRPLEIKKILRDAIEDDIMERTLTYIDKVRV